MATHTITVNTEEFEALVSALELSAQYRSLTGYFDDGEEDENIQENLRDRLSCQFDNETEDY